MSDETTTGSAAQDEDEEIGGDIVSDRDQERDGDEKPKAGIDVKIDTRMRLQRHITVTIRATKSNRYFSKAFSELMGTAAVPGFRAGCAPRNWSKSGSARTWKTRSRARFDGQPGADLRGARAIADQRAGLQPLADRKYPTKAR